MFRATHFLKPETEYRKNDRRAWGITKGNGISSGSSSDPFGRFFGNFLVGARKLPAGGITHFATKDFFPPAGGHTFSPARKYAKRRRETFRRFPGPFPRPKGKGKDESDKQLRTPLSPYGIPLVVRKTIPCSYGAMQLFRATHFLKPETEYRKNESCLPAGITSYHKERFLLERIKRLII